MNDLGSMRVLQDTLSRDRERRRRRANTLYEFEMALREEGPSDFVYDEGEDLFRFCSQIRSHLCIRLSRNPYLCGLAAIPRALGARCFYVLLASFGRFFGVWRNARPLGAFVGLPGSFGTHCLFYSFVASLRGLLGVLRALLAHGALLLWSYRLSPIKRTRSTVRQE
jgi:hypothetical protein